MRKPKHHRYENLVIYASTNIWSWRNRPHVRTFVHPSMLANVKCLTISFKVQAIYKSCFTWYWTLMLWSHDSCQNRVFADQYHITASRARMYNSLRWNFLKVLRWPVMVLKWSQAHKNFTLERHFSKLPTRAWLLALAKSKYYQKWQWLFRLPLFVYQAVEADSGGPGAVAERSLCFFFKNPGIPMLSPLKNNKI